MAVTGGLTSAGFVAPTTAEIAEDVTDQLLVSIDPALDLSADQPLGEVVQIEADEMSSAWDTVATVYDALNPDAAEGILLDNVCAITGTRRRSATYSYLYLVQLTLSATTTVNSGAIAYVNGQPGNTWVLQSTVTSTSAGVYTATFQSSVAGPYVANAGTLTQIATPVSGWTAVYNPADSVEGIVEDTDTTLRVRRLAELEATSVGTTDGQLSALLKVPGVQNAFVFENVLNVTATDGTPPHYTHAIVWAGGSPPPGINDLIATAIWSKKCAGIGTYGSQSGTTTDLAGNIQTLFYDYSTQVQIYVICVATPAPGVTIGSTEAAAIKSALVAYGNANFTTGATVYYSDFRADAIVPGVSVDVTTFQIGTAPSPTGTVAIPIDGTQIAVLQSANISVNGF